MTGGSANRRRRQSEGAHHAGESRWPRKQQMNPAGTTRIRFRKVSAFPDSFLTPHRSPQNEGRTESHPRALLTRRARSAPTFHLVVSERKPPLSSKRRHNHFLITPRHDISAFQEYLCNTMIDNRSIYLYLNPQSHKYLDTFGNICDIRP